MLALASAWCGALRLATAEEKAGLSSPLTTVPRQYEQATDEEGPLAGLWHAVTGTPPAPPAPLSAVPGGKKAKPKPLTLRDYLNQQTDASTDNPHLLRYGF